MKNSYFDYSIPKIYELKEMYQTPYKFSKKLRNRVDYIFLHPKNKYNKIYNNLHKDTDSNDMLKSAYLNVRYYMDNPQQFNHTMTLIAPQVLVSMWKAFLSLNKHLRGNQYDIYHKTQMELLPLIEDGLLEMILADINNNKIIMSGNDMVKVRKGKGLREQNRGSMKEGGKNFEYLCSLE